MSTISKNTISRLPIYYRLLLDLKKSGVKEISSKMIADCLNMNCETVRKDLQQISKEDGKPHKGRKIESLIFDLSKALGYSSINSAILVGAGHLGTALMKYSGLKQYGIKIVAAFDNSEDKIGYLVNGIEVENVSKLKEREKVLNASIGIICVPASEAQKIADILVDSGIEGILNLAPTSLKLPKSIALSNLDVGESLAHLAYQMYIKKIN